jgi:hypothetical protein
LSQIEAALRNELLLDRFDTLQHPAPDKINAFRNEISPAPTNPFDTFRHFLKDRGRSAKRNGSRTDSTYLDTQLPTQATPYETKSPAPTNHFDTFRHPAPNEINAVRNEMTSASVARQPEMVIAIR